MANKLISAAVLPRMFEIALHSHVNVASLFENAGIDADAVGRPDHYVTLEQVDLLLGRAYEQVEDPLFGLHVGMKHEYATLDLAGRLMASSATLEQAFAMLLRYKDLFAPHLEFTLESRGPNRALCVRPDPGLSFTATRLHGELMVTSMLSVISSLLGKRLPLERACFAYPAPGQEALAEYRRYFGCELVFDAPCAAVEFDRIWLSVPLPGAYPEYRQRLEQKAMRALRSLSQAGSLSQRVMGRLMEQLGHGPLTVERVAEDLNMTARTLQRHLREENTRFARLRDHVRMEYACRQLSSGDCDKAALAHYLGFSDTANFYHAFKRWKGCAPGEYRRRQTP